MKRSILLVLMFSMLATVAYSQGYARKELSVTVYNENLGVVRDTRLVEVPAGISDIKIMDVAQLIDPTSVHIKLDASVLEQNFEYDLVSMSKVLEKYIDNDVMLEGDRVISGKLLSVTGNQIVVRSADGGLVMIPDIDKYQIKVGSLPEGLMTRPTLVWKVDSKTSGARQAELTYQTGGMGWHAEYVAVLNDKDTRADLNAWVSVDNKSGTTYKDATLKLVAGEVHRAQQPQPRVMTMKMEAAPMAMASQFEEQAFFEYHIYNLQRPTTLANNETKQVSLFEASGIAINKRFLYPSYGYTGENKKVNVVVEFDNKKENNLGMPMPKGKVRLYKSDGKSIEFIGEDNIDHTPKDEKLKLKVGDAFDVLADESVSDQKKISKNVTDYTYSVKIKNHKDEDITVDVERQLWGDWDILNSSLKYTKLSQQKVVFPVAVKANSESTLEYTVRFKY